MDEAADWLDLCDLTQELSDEDITNKVRICVDGEFKLCRLLTSIDDDIMADGTPYLEVIE